MGELVLGVVLVVVSLVTGIPFLLKLTGVVVGAALIGSSALAYARERT